jgi:hypothetical protein
MTVFGRFWATLNSRCQSDNFAPFSRFCKILHILQKCKAGALHRSKPVQKFFRNFENCENADEEKGALGSLGSTSS